MSEPFPSYDELGARAGVDPWRLRDNLASGNPAEITNLAKAFADASGDAQLAGQLAREASELTAQGYTVDGTPVHNVSAHVQATRKRLGDDGHKCLTIARALDAISDDLEQRTTAARNDVLALERELGDLRRRYDELAGKNPSDLPIAGMRNQQILLVTQAIGKVRSYGDKIHRSVSEYEQHLAARLKSLSDLGYTPPHELNEGPGDPTSMLRIGQFNMAMGHDYHATTDTGVEPWEIGKIADLIARQGLDVATLDEFHDVPGLREQLERELEARTGQKWNLIFTRSATATHAGAGYDNVPAGTLIAVKQGDGLASVADLGDTALGPTTHLRGVRLTTKDGGALNVYTTHLPADGKDAPALLDRARAIVDASGQPSVLTGDYNRTGLGEQVKSHGYTDVGEHAGNTFSKTIGPFHPRSRIDYILSKGVPGDHTHTFEGDPGGNGHGTHLSDHDGLVTDVQAPQAPVDPHP